MLLSAPATTALDALLASLAPALSGDHSKTPATAAFKNVLDDLTLLEDPQPDGNAKPLSAIPEPASKKQQPQAAGSFTDVTAVPQTTGVKLPQARLALPQAGLYTAPDENVAPSTASSLAPSNDSQPALPLQGSTSTSVTPAVPAQTGPVTNSASSAAPGAKTFTHASVLTLIPFGTTGARTPVREAPQPRGPARNVSTPPVASVPNTPENVEAPSTSVVAALTQAPAKLPVSIPTPPVVRPAQQPATGKPSANPAIDQNAPHIVDQNNSAAREKSVPIFTTRSTKNSAPETHAAPIAFGTLARANTTPAAGSPVPPAIRPDATLTVNSGETVAASQQPATKPNASGSAPDTWSARKVPAPAPSFTAASPAREFLTAPVPVAPALDQTPQQQTPQEQTPLEQTTMPAATSPSAAPNLEQAAAPSAPATASSPVTSMPAASLPAMAPAHVTTSQPAVDRTSPPAGPLASQSETPGVTAGATNPLLPQAENFAFAVRLLGLDDSSSHAPLTESGTAPGSGDPSPTQPKQAAAQPQNSQAPPAVAPQGQNPSQQNVGQQTANQPYTNQATHDTPAAATATDKPEPAAQNQPGLSGAPKPAQPSHPGDAPVFEIPQQAPQVQSPASGPERGEAAEPHVLLAAQDTRFGGAELPRSSASSEILLHLASDGQSSAAIRVADRAGSVNVSVHAADPILRESLKTDLGDLSAQLNLQGWKTETTKSAAVAAHSDTPQDSHSGGQRGSGQQGSGGDRHTPRERRGNGGQWRQTFDQQITSNETHPGANR